ncbi:MAG: hypothetical protein ACI9XK_004849 [Granulosicoccus sp.]|jgi:hypothetical protein
MILETLGKVILENDFGQESNKKCSRRAKNAQLGLRGNAARYEYYT